MNLGENIYRLRTEKNMSQGDLADALNVSRQSVSKWENNSATPELEKLLKMSELFGVSLDELVTGTQAAPSSQAASVHKIEHTLPHIPARKLAGVLLLICAFLCFLVPTSLGDPGTGLLLCIPFAVCGIIYLKARKHPGFYCLIALYLLLWIPFGILSPNYIRLSFAGTLQLIHMAYGLFLLFRGYHLDQKENLFPDPRCALVLFSIICFTILLSFFAFLFPGLLPTPGLLYS